MRAGVTSVRVRATVAATLVVAAALGMAAAVLVVSLRGSLTGAAGEEAARRAGAAVTAIPASACPVAEAVRVYPAEEVHPVEGKALPATPLSPPSGEASRGDRVVADPDVCIARQGEPEPGWAPAEDYAVAMVMTADGSALWARASLEGVEQALRTLHGVLLPGVPALLAVVAGMTWLAVGRALGPVGAIRSKLAHITARELHERVPVPGSRDEIAALAATVNDTLDRLETAVETHKRFVADAAHELRSPIATLRARLELAEPSELTREGLADLDRLQSLAAGLLLLARLDSGERPGMTEVDLGQVAAEESLRVERRSGVELAFDIEPDVLVEGSRPHLGRLVTNLVGNAARHATGRVTVQVVREEGRAVLRVRDDGPGIPPEHREAVFDRFTRLDEARARDAGGAGLGLPIARDIAHLHGGTLVAEDGGLVATFPALPAHPPTARR